MFDKEFEALKIVDNILDNFGGDKVQIETMTLSKCNILKIKQALLKAEKLEKAWEVVKEKNVDVALIRLCKDSGEYNGEITLQDEWWHRKLLTEEEFELIKGMIE